MSIQAIFDEQAIDLLPKIKSAIESAGDFDANQMKSYALKEILDSKIAISDMSADQIIGLQRFLLEIFDSKGWISKLYMNPETGSVDTYGGWDYQDEDGKAVNAVDLGEVVEVLKNEEGEWEQI